jgi:hypothetical protein
VKDKAKEDRVDAQLYDDKDPCETCEPNLNYQVKNERMNVDLHMPENEEERGKNRTGKTKYHRTYDKDKVESEKFLKTRGRGETKEQRLEQMTKKLSRIQSLETQSQKKLETLEEQINTATGKKREGLEKQRLQVQQKQRGVERERQQIEARINEIQNWPPIKKTKEGEREKGESSSSTHPRETSIIDNREGREKPEIRASGSVKGKEKEGDPEIGASASVRGKAEGKAQQGERAGEERGRARESGRQYMGAQVGRKGIVMDKKAKALEPALENGKVQGGEIAGEARGKSQRSLEKILESDRKK